MLCGLYSGVVMRSNPSMQGGWAADLHARIQARSGKAGIQLPLGEARQMEADTLRFEGQFDANQ